MIPIEIINSIMDDTREIKIRFESQGTNYSASHRLTKSGALDMRRPLHDNKACNLLVEAHQAWLQQGCPDKCQFVSRKA